MFVVNINDMLLKAILAYLIEQGYIEAKLNPNKHQTRTYTNYRKHYFITKQGRAVLEAWQKAATLFNKASCLNTQQNTT